MVIPSGAERVKSPVRKDTTAKKDIKHTHTPSYISRTRSDSQSLKREGKKRDRNNLFEV